jgi:hypothetical protein
MKSFAQTNTDFTTLSHDASTANVALGKSLINTCIKKVLSLSNWTFNKDSKTYASVALQQEYDPPYNAAKLEYVNVYYGGVWYAPIEVRNGTQWRLLNNVTVYSDIPNYWYVSNRTKKWSLSPIPSSTGTVIKVGFTKKIRDLSVADYTTGTITTTANSTAIVGVLTVWTKRMIGEYIKITSADTIVGDYWFEITGVTDATHLTVREEVPVAVAGASYTIAEMIPLPDGFEDIPLWYALSIYYQQREQPVLAGNWERMYKEGIAELERRDARSVVGILEQQGEIGGIDPNSNVWGIEIIP